LSRASISYSRAAIFYSRAALFYSCVSIFFSRATIFHSCAAISYSRATIFHSRAAISYSRATIFYSCAAIFYSRATEEFSTAAKVCSILPKNRLNPAAALISPQTRKIFLRGAQVASWLADVSLVPWVATCGPVWLAVIAGRITGERGGQ